MKHVCAFCLLFYYTLQSANKMALLFVWIYNLFAVQYHTTHSVLSTTKHIPREHGFTGGQYKKFLIETNTKYLHQDTNTWYQFQLKISCIAHCKAMFSGDLFCGLHGWAREGYWCTEM